ncbi:MAG: hypothetical protein QXG98_04745 [Candidatus Micrarchaeia archaeon]
MGNQIEKRQQQLPPPLLDVDKLIIKILENLRRALGTEGLQSRLPSREIITQLLTDALNGKKEAVQLLTESLLAYNYLSFSVPKELKKYIEDRLAADIGQINNSIGKAVEMANALKEGFAPQSNLPEPLVRYEKTEHEKILASLGYKLEIHIGLNAAGEAFRHRVWVNTQNGEVVVEALLAGVPADKLEQAVAEKAVSFGEYSAFFNVMFVGEPAGYHRYAVRVSDAFSFASPFLASELKAIKEISTNYRMAQSLLPYSAQLAKQLEKNIMQQRGDLLNDARALAPPGSQPRTLFLISESGGFASILYYHSKDEEGRERLVVVETVPRGFKKPAVRVYRGWEDFFEHTILPNGIVVAEGVEPERAFIKFPESSVEKIMSLLGFAAMGLAMMPEAFGTKTLAAMLAVPTMMYFLIHSVEDIIDKAKREKIYLTDIELHRDIGMLLLTVITRGRAGAILRGLGLGLFIESDVREGDEVLNKLFDEYQNLPEKEKKEYLVNVILPQIAVLCANLALNFYFTEKEIKSAGKLVPTERTIKLKPTRVIELWKKCGKIKNYEEYKRYYDELLKVFNGNEVELEKNLRRYSYDPKRLIEELAKPTRARDGTLGREAAEKLFALNYPKLAEKYKIVGVITIDLDKAGNLNNLYGPGAEEIYTDIYRQLGIRLEGIKKRYNAEIIGIIRSPASDELRIVVFSNDPQLMQVIAEEMGKAISEIPRIPNDPQNIARNHSAKIGVSYTPTKAGENPYNLLYSLISESDKLVVELKPEGPGTRVKTGKTKTIRSLETFKPIRENLDPRFSQPVLNESGLALVLRNEPNAFVVVVDTNHFTAATVPPLRLSGGLKRMNSISYEAGNAYLRLLAEAYVNTAKEIAEKYGTKAFVFNIGGDRFGVVFVGEYSSRITNDFIAAFKSRIKGAKIAGVNIAEEITFSFGVNPNPREIRDIYEAFSAAATQRAGGGIAHVGEYNTSLNSLWLRMLAQLKGIFNEMYYKEPTKAIQTFKEIMGEDAFQNFILDTEIEIKEITLNLELVRGLTAERYANAITRALMKFFDYAVPPEIDPMFVAFLKGETSQGRAIIDYLRMWENSIRRKIEKGEGLTHLEERFIKNIQRSYVLRLTSELSEFEKAIVLAVTDPQRGPLYLIEPPMQTLAPETLYSYLRIPPEERRRRMVSVLMQISDDFEKLELLSYFNQFEGKLSSLGFERAPQIRPGELVRLYSREEVLKVLEKPIPASIISVKFEDKEGPLTEMPQYIFNYVVGSGEFLAHFGEFKMVLAEYLNVPEVDVKKITFLKRGIAGGVFFVEAEYGGKTYSLVVKQRPYEADVFGSELVRKFAPELPVPHTAGFEIKGIRIVVEEAYRPILFEEFAQVKGMPVEELKQEILKQRFRFLAVEYLLGLHDGHHNNYILTEKGLVRIDLSETMETSQLVFNLWRFLQRSRIDIPREMLPELERIFVEEFNRIAAQKDEILKFVEEAIRKGIKTGSYTPYCNSLSGEYNLYPITSNDLTALSGRLSENPYEIFQQKIIRGLRAWGLQLPLQSTTLPAP